MKSLILVACLSVFSAYASWTTVFSSQEAIALKDPELETTIKNQVLFYLPDATMDIKFKSIQSGAVIASLDVCLTEEGLLACTVFPEVSLNEFNLIERADLDFIKEAVIGPKVVRFSSSVEDRYFMERK